MPPGPGPAHLTDSVAGWYRKRHVARGLPDGETGAVTAFQRANSDLRLSPRFHPLFLDRIYAPDRDGKGLMSHPAPAPGQEDIEQLALQVSKRILRFLQRRGVIVHPMDRASPQDLRLRDRLSAVPPNPPRSPRGGRPGGCERGGEGFFDAEIPPLFRLGARVVSMGRLVASDAWFRLDILGILFG